ncbi:hypothetical protein ACH5RR_003810 [Cinchona calisaya]|uniref:Uncharacterized protein n=1 Tax=Cinchona calisaya TaxID=153742 RepID=A0ABD3AVU5_9GENT
MEIIIRYPNSGKGKECHHTGTNSKRPSFDYADRVISNKMVGKNEKRFEIQNTTKAVYKEYKAKEVKVSAKTQTTIAVDKRSKNYEFKEEVKYCKSSSKVDHKVGGSRIASHTEVKIKKITTTTTTTKGSSSGIKPSSDNRRIKYYK